MHLLPCGHVLKCGRRDLISDMRLLPCGHVLKCGRRGDMRGLSGQRLFAAGQHILLRLRL